MKDAKCASLPPKRKPLTEVDIGTFAAHAARIVFGEDVSDDVVAAFTERLLTLNDVAMEIRDYAKIRIVSGTVYKEGACPAKVIHVKFSYRMHHPKTQRLSHLTDQWIAALNGLFRKRTGHERPPWVKIHIGTFH